MTFAGSEWSCADVFGRQDVPRPGNKVALGHGCNLFSPACQDQLAECRAGFELGVGLAEVGGVDGREGLAQGGAEFPGVHQVGQLVEDLVLALSRERNRSVFLTRVVWLAQV